MKARRPRAGDHEARSGRSRVRRLDVILTSRCNLACGYCFENAKQDRRMSWQTLAAAIDLLLQSPARELRLQFFGGEPLLEFELIRQAVEYAAGLQQRNPALGARRLRFSIITNGTLLDEARAAFLARNRILTQLSHDGVRAAQDQRGAGTFERLDRLLDLLARRHPAWCDADLTLSMTVSSANLGYLADSVGYFLGRGVANINLGVLYTHDPLWRPERIEELREQMERVLELSLRHHRKTGAVPVVLFRRERESTTSSPAGTAMCGAGGGEHLAVDVDGELVGCATWARSYQRFASPFLRQRLDALRLPSLGDAELPRRLALYRGVAASSDLLGGKANKHSSYGRCGDCRHVGQCGVCPVSIGMIPGNEDPTRVPDLGCAFNLVTLDCRARFPAVDATLAGRLSRRRARMEAQL